MSKIWCIVWIIAALVFCRGWAIAADTDDENTSPSMQAAGNPAVKDIDGDPNKADIMQVIAAKVMLGYSDGTFKPNAKVNEDAFGKVVERLLLACSEVSEASFSVRNPNARISRIRALTVIVRSVASPGGVEGISDAADALSSCGDAASVPGWAQKYAAYALGIGLMKPGKIRPNDPITRSELAAMLARALSWSAGGKSQPLVTEKPTIYTSLVIDCRGLDIRRSMCPEIRAKDGKVIYPDYKNPPSIDFVEDCGLVAYARELSGTKRAGSTPLVVKAIDIVGTGNQAAVISDDDLGLILEQEKSSHFLAKWNVVFLKD